MAAIILNHFMTGVKGKIRLNREFVYGCICKEWSYHGESLLPMRLRRLVFVVNQVLS